MPEQSNPTGNCVTFISLAVAPEFQGQGIGKLLVKALLNEPCLRESKCENLTNDAVDNDSVNNFYKSQGFELFGKTQLLKNVS